MRKFSCILVLLLVLGAVFISGCSDSEESTQTTSDSTVDTNDVTDSGSNIESDSSSSAETSSSSSSDNTVVSSSGTYVGNKNTKVFHLSTCSYVDRMKEENKVFFSSRAEAINAGYRPCKVCNP